MSQQPCFRRRQTILLGLAFVLLLALSRAAKFFVMPTPQPAKSYPAHDDHPGEAVAVALDPYDPADKAKIFTVNYRDSGILPIFVIVTNDGDQAVALAGMKAE